jgi:hypothetical protein
MQHLTVIQVLVYQKNRASSMESSVEFYLLLLLFIYPVDQHTDHVGCHKNNSVIDKVFKVTEFRRAEQYSKSMNIRRS